LEQRSCRRATGVVGPGNRQKRYFAQALFEAVSSLLRLLSAPFVEFSFSTATS
jgi:hypothetical protein